MARRLARVRARIASVGAPAGAVTVIAVTKGFGPEAVEAAVAAGIEDIGENYAQEMLAKLDAAPVPARWHFLGELQTNKLARLAPHVHLWHGLDSEAKATELSHRRPGAAVLVQVRVSGLPPRHGAEPAQVPAIVEKAASAGLDVQGLMAVGPRGARAEEARACFREVARLARSMALEQLSMGMSDDFEQAVAEGATMVRLGRALFGERP
ncbi:MAG: YggS family pyridoxal phosphate-dependent enzyme [Acidimicrobiales bacterium]